MRATTPATLCLSFPLAAHLRTFIVSSTSGLGQDSGVLYLAVETFECYFKGIARIDVNVTHDDYQRLPWS